MDAYRLYTVMLLLILYFGIENVLLGGKYYLGQDKISFQKYQLSR